MGQEVAMPGVSAVGRPSTMVLRFGVIGEVLVGGASVWAAARGARRSARSWRLCARASARRRARSKARPRPSGRRRRSAQGQHPVEVVGRPMHAAAQEPVLDDDLVGARDDAASALHRAALNGSAAASPRPPFRPSLPLLPSSFAESCRAPVRALADSRCRLQAT